MVWLLVVLQTVEAASFAALPGTTMTSERIAAMGLTPQGGYCSSLEDIGCCHYDGNSYSECLFTDGVALSVGVEGQDIYHVEVDVSRVMVASGNVRFTSQMTLYDAARMLTAHGRRSAEALLVYSQSENRLIVHANENLPDAMLCRAQGCRTTLEFGADGHLQSVVWSIHVF